MQFSGKYWWNSGLATPLVLVHPLRNPGSATDTSCFKNISQQELKDILWSRCKRSHLETGPPVMMLLENWRCFAHKQLFWTKLETFFSLESLNWNLMFQFEGKARSMAADKLSRSGRIVYSAVLIVQKVVGSRSEPSPMLVDMSASTWIEQVSCHADLCTVSRCHTRGKSEDHTSEKACKGSILALKHRADVTRSPKQGYQWNHEKESSSIGCSDFYLWWLVETPCRLDHGCLYPPFPWWVSTNFSQHTAPFSVHRIFYDKQWKAIFKNYYNLQFIGKGYLRLLILARMCTLEIP